MPRITQVEKQKNNPQRYNIYIDGVFGFGADEDTVVAQRLVVGKELDPEKLEKVLFETEVGKLMDRIYGLLSKRARSEREIRDYLKNLSFKRKVRQEEELSAVVIESTIERLKKKNLLNDLEFAKSWVESRGRKRGKNLLKSELYKKGIDREIIDQVLEEKPQISEEAVAARLLEKKMESWKNLKGLEQRKKAIEFLVRKGFEYSLVRDLVEKMIKKEYNL